MQRSSADIVIVADADCWTEGVESAVRAVTCGVAGWAVPHAPDIRRLSVQGTRAVLGGEAWEDQELEVRPYQGVIGGGIVVGLREVFLDCPLDPRFIGFGTEDISWGYALQTLHGEPWRGTESLVHLWHPSQERLDRRYGSLESKRLGRRYYDARIDPQAMRALLDEIGDPCAFTAPPTRASASALRLTG